MSESKHTPGPWVMKEYGGKDSRFTFAVTAPDDNSVVAEVARVFLRTSVVNGEDIERDRANARLIAAAPDLLAELKSLLDMPAACISDDEIIENKKRRLAAQAVVAKAEGHSS